MESREFYKKMDEYVKSMEKEELIDFFNNVIRKIPENKFEEILCISDNNKKMNEVEIKKKVKEYKEQFKKIDDGDLFFYAEPIDEYDYWENWGVVYTDRDNIGGLINGLLDYAIKLVNNKEYSYAKELLDLVISTNYQAYDEYTEEFLEISLDDIRTDDLMFIDISEICLYLIYATYQTSDNKVKDIYNYLKNNPNFRNISIERAFLLGTEKLKKLDEFFVEWISFLSQIKGDIERRLLREALNYTDYVGYERYVGEITKNHPELYIDIFNYLERENKLIELNDLGKEVLKNLNKDSKAGSDIALYLANIDTRNKEKYICEAFMFDTSVLNLLRIINNGYYNNNENDIKNKIENAKENNIIDEKTYYLLQFFCGNFEKFFNESIKHENLLGWTCSFEKTSVYLWLLLLNESDEKTESYSKIILDILLDIDYNGGSTKFLDYDVYEIWKKWKCNFKLDEDIKAKVIKWLSEIVEKRVYAILEGNHRSSYYKIALLVVAYSEMMSSQNLGKKGEYISYYINKYSRRTAFRRELNKLL